MKISANIAALIAKALGVTQQQQPELLQEKYQGYPWHTEDFQERFCQQVADKFTGSKNRDQYLKAVAQVLNVVVKAEFFGSDRFLLLRQDLDGLLPPTPMEPAPDSELWPDYLQHRPGAIACLLLDAENLNLEASFEQKIKGLSTYPIQVKIAFGNWKKLGKQDLNYHNRSYELIHVPPHQNSADFKLTTFGASLWRYYPQIKEVFIGSGDAAFTHLGNSLQAQGLEVYLVSRLGYQLKVNHLNNQSETLINVIVPENLPTMDEFLAQLQALIPQTQTRQGQHWVSLSMLADLYRRSHQLSVNEVLSYLSPEHKLRDLLGERPDLFGLHQLPNQSEVYVCLFENPAFKAIQNLAKTKNLPVEELEEIAQFTPEKLNQALINLCQELQDKNQQTKISLSELAAHFDRQFQIPLTRLLKHLNLPSKLPNYFQKSPVFTIDKKQKQYYLNIKKNIPTQKLATLAIDGLPALTTEIKTIIQTLTAHHGTESVHISKVHAAFLETHKLTVREVLNQYDFSGNYLEFLRQEPTFNLEQQAKGWFVSVAIANQ